MYKVFIAATLLASAVNAMDYGYSPKMKESPSYDSQPQSYDNYKPSSDKMSSYEKPSSPQEQPCESGGAGVHDVMVGGEAGLLYTPSSVLANVGDKVRFHFLMKNHTVTQSTFDKPCVKKPDGVDSNFRPTMRGEKDLKMESEDSGDLVWEYEVTSMDPTWWYCRQRTGTHCGKGMVFAINPNKEKTFEKFKEMAQQQNGTADATPPPPPPPEANNEPPPPPQQMQEGYNGGSSGGACSCQCLCSVSSFPAGSEWGIGMSGGMGGIAQAPWSSGSYSPSGEY